MENLTKSKRQEQLVLLQTYDFDNAFKKIREILSKVSRVDYAPIIYGLVKIDILHQNNEYDYVKGMLASIREKKSFYRHRITDNPRVLSLTLKPKRKKSNDE